MLCNVSSYVVIQHCLALPNMNKNWLSMYYGEYTMVLYSMVEKCYNGYELVVFSGHGSSYIRRIHTCQDSYR